MKRIKFDYLFYIAIVLILLLFAIAARAQQSSGENFTITKTVIAGGGAPVQNGQTALHGTAGQTAAGVNSTGGQFSLYSGFWTPDAPLAPTAANVVAGGRITTATGKGIRNVAVTITFPSGETLTTYSTALGYYRFTDVPAGDTYVFAVRGKRFTFVQSAQVRAIDADTEDINFVGETAEKIVPKDF